MPDASSWRPSLTFSRCSLQKARKGIDSQNSDHQPNNADGAEDETDIKRKELIVESNSEHNANLPICADGIGDHGYAASRIWKPRGTNRANLDQQPTHVDGPVAVGIARNNELTAQSHNERTTVRNSCTEVSEHSRSDLAAVTESRSNRKGLNAWKPRLKESSGSHIICNSHAKEDHLQTAAIGEPGCSKRGSSAGIVSPQSNTVESGCIGFADMPQQLGVRGRVPRNSSIGAHLEAKCAPVGAKPFAPPAEVDECRSQAPKGRVQSDAIGAYGKAKRDPVGAKLFVSPLQADKCLSQGHHRRVPSDRVKHNKNHALAKKEACEGRPIKDSMQSVLRIEVADSVEHHGQAQVEVHEILEQPCRGSDGMSALLGLPAYLEQEEVQSEGGHVTSTDPPDKALMIDRNAAHEGADLFSNTCVLCGKTRLLVIDCGAEFVCEEAGERCSKAKQQAKGSKAEEFPSLLSPPQAETCPSLPTSNKVQAAQKGRIQPFRTKPYKNNVYAATESMESVLRTEFADSATDAGTAEMQTHHIFEPPCNPSKEMLEPEVRLEACSVSVKQPPDAVRMLNTGNDGMWDLSNLSAGLDEEEFHQEDVNEEAGLKSAKHLQDEVLFLDSQVEPELFLNTCSLCGETRLFVIDCGEEFVCAEAGETCTTDVADGPIAKDRHGGRWADEAIEEENDDTVEDMSLRRRLLQEVSAKHLTVLEAADLFLCQGEQPPSELELKAQLVDVQQRAREQKLRQQARVENAAWRAAQKKQQRYMDGQLVEVQRGSKYLVPPKESAVERAKTSVSIVIQGTRRVVTREKEKRGPRS